MPAEPTHAEIVAELTARWPEHRIAPTLGRITALTELLGDPQRAYRVVHLTGTNGKTSTSRMADDLLRARGLRTGRFTSPHVRTRGGGAGPRPVGASPASNPPATASRRSSSCSATRSGPTAWCT